MSLKYTYEDHPECPDCGSGHVGPAGRAFRSMSNDLVQRYKCADCGRTWTAGCFMGHKFSRDMIFQAMEMVRQGYSYRVTAEAISDWSGRGCSGATVANWVEDFASELAEPSRVDLPTPSFLKRVRSKGRRAPVIHLSDLSPSRRVVVDDSLWELIHWPQFKPHPVIYQLKYTRRYLTVEKCRIVARVLGKSMQAIEKHVTAVYAGKSGQSKKVAVRFPLRATKSHAFLIGLFYSSGGAGASTLHFAIDKQVGDYLTSPVISRDIGEAPTNLKQGSKLRKVHGTHSYAYSITVFELLKLFGLRTTVHFIQLGRGKYVPSRGLTVKVPLWIRRDPAFTHAFVEGYINGIRTSAGLAGRADYRRKLPVSWSTDMHRVVYANVKISFSNYNDKELMALVRVVVKHLKAFGVDGWVSKLRVDGRKMQHYSYGFHSLPPLQAFYKHFTILRPMIKTKLALRLNRDPVVIHILQKTRDLDNFVLGMLMQRPMTTAELVDLCPRRPYNMSTSVLLKPSLVRLERMGVLTRVGSAWTYDPTNFAREHAQEYIRRLEVKEKMVRSLRGKPLYLCKDCHDVGTTPDCETCGKPRPRCTEYELRRFLDNKAVRIIKDMTAAAAASGWSDANT